MKVSKIIGIGNALTDMLVNMNSDSVLAKYELPKGSMTLIDAEQQREILNSVAGRPRTLSLGGSAGNTIRTIARLGCPVGLIGKVGHDDTGAYFTEALKNLNIEPFVYKGSVASGTCASLISPDGERTMCTYLGSALELTMDDIPSTIFDGYDTLYVEGYLVQNHSLIEGVTKMAKDLGLNIAIDLASFNIVEENLEFLRNLVKNYVDIVFANEDEIGAFSGLDTPRDGLNMLAEMCELAIVKVGIKGAMIKRGSEIVNVGILAAAKRVDTTGAGDFYAAGFLAGMSWGLTLRQCGTIGAITAGKVIEVVGTTFDDDAWDEVFKLVEMVKTSNYLF